MGAQYRRRVPKDVDAFGGGDCQGSRVRAEKINDVRGLARSSGVLVVVVSGRSKSALVRNSMETECVCENIHSRPKPPVSNGLRYCMHIS